uniref:Uncharacterized protein n=1 Tax=Sphaerodactylus townsendi TaxID=933632 RepID=A0ACB8FF71_9SAUR
MNRKESQGHGESVSAFEDALPVGYGHRANPDQSDSVLFEKSFESYKSGVSPQTLPGEFSPRHKTLGKLTRRGSAVNTFYHRMLKEMHKKGNMVGTQPSIKFHHDNMGCISFTSSFTFKKIWVVLPLPLWERVVPKPSDSKSGVW